MAKTNIDVSLRKIHALTSKIILSEEKLQLFFTVTFNIIISYIFPKNFIEIHQVSQNVLIFISFTTFANFLDF